MVDRVVGHGPTVQFGLEGPGHTPPVLVHGKPIVVGSIRERLLGQQVVLVGRVGQATAQHLEVTLLPGMHDVHHVAGLGQGVGTHTFLRVEPGHPERYHAHAGQLGETVQDTQKRVVQHLAVVDTRADHDLAVHLHPMVQQRTQPAQARGTPPVPQHGSTHLRVGGVDADIQRAQSFGHHTFEVGFGEAGEGGEVPVQERQPVVVVLLIEAAPQAFGQLVDETELTVVVTRPHLVEQGRVDLDAQRVTMGFADLHREVQPAAPQLDGKVGLVHEQTPLDEVAGDLAVEGDNLVTCLHTDAFGRRGRRDSNHTGQGHSRRVYRPDDRVEGTDSQSISLMYVDTGNVDQTVDRTTDRTAGDRASGQDSTQVDKVLLAAPRGFCAGVEMAIKALSWMVRSFEPPVYCYHEIVHNQLVVQRFRDLGVVFVDDIAEVPEGRPIMLSAHGSAPEVVEAARTRGSYVVNAVCPLVTKVHHEVKVRSGKGYRIVYVGHEGHEEAVGTMAVAPDQIDLVESVEDVDHLDLGDEPVALLAQTTLSHREWSEIAARSEERFPDLWRPGRSDLCFATTNRQSALAEIAPRCDAVVVIGSSNSSNTRALERLAVEAGCSRVVRVNGADELPDDLAGTVGVTAGASAPEDLVTGVIGRLAPREGTEEVRITEEDEYFPPPRELRELLAGLDVAATFAFGGSVPDRPSLDDRSLGASEVLSSLH